MLARSLDSDKEFEPNIDGACLMRLSGIDEVSKVVSVIEVEGGSQRKEQGNGINETVSTEVAVGISLN